MTYLILILFIITFYNIQRIKQLKSYKNLFKNLNMALFSKKNWRNLTKND